MRGNNVMGILFAYVHEERVRELTGSRVMASIPFGGRYRLVDFPLSCMVASGINNVGVITEENYQSLMDHLGSGKAWDLSRKRDGLYLLPPFGADTRGQGKISALASIMRFLKNSTEEYVLISNCDVIANVDFKKLHEYHDEKKADVTVLYRHGICPDTDRNITYTTDPDGRVREMLIKRGGGIDCNYGLGVYLMSRVKLMEMVEDCMSRNQYDFARDLLQRHVDDLRIYGYGFTGACYTIDSFNSYFNANMALMDPEVRAELFNPDRPIFTKVRDDLSARYGLGSVVRNSLVADGCVVEGEVENCVLFRGVHVKKGAKLKNCVIMQDSVVGENARLNYVVADKEVVFGDNGEPLMGRETYPVYVAKGSKV